MIEIPDRKSRAKRRLARGTGTPREVKKRPKVEEGNKRGRGRPPGAQNYYTRQVKEAILEAANQLGEDGEGYDGLVGYMRFLGRSEPKTFAMLLRAVMPTQVDIKTVEQVGRPKRYQTSEEVLEELKMYGIVPQEQKALPHYVGPEIELDAEDVGSDGTPEAAG